MSSLNERKRDKLEWQARERRKNAYPPQDQVDKHLKALAKLHSEFTHLRTCKELKLSNETAIHWSDTMDRYILCGMSYTTYTKKGERLKLEVLHLESDWFKIVIFHFSLPYDQKTTVLDCKLRFKELVKFILFCIPILKGD